MKNFFCFLFFLFLFSYNVYANDVLLLSTEYNYSHWTPTGIDGVDYDTQGLNILDVTLDFDPLRKKLSSKIPIFVPPIPTIRYLFTPNSKVEQKDLLDRTNNFEGKEAMEHFFIDFPLFSFGTDDYVKDDSMLFRFILKYEEAAFISNLKLREKKYYIPFGGESSSLSEGDILSQKTDFKKTTAMLEISLGKHQTVGVGRSIKKYRKPYSLTINGATNSDVILDSKFSSKGVSFLYSVHTSIDSDWFFSFNFSGSYGKGDIKFSDSKSINSYLKPYETTALAFTNIELESRVNLTKDIKISATLGYDHYDFHRAEKTSDGGISSSRTGNDLDLNMDKIFYFRFGTVIAF